MAWDLSCPDWEKRIRKGESLIPKLPLDLVEAEKGVAVFDRLRIPDIPDRPTLKDASRDWFRDIVRVLFGSIDINTRRRMVREIFLLIAKKNNKTTGGAAIMLTALLLNKRPRAQFHLIGPAQDTADLAFDQVIGMIEADDIKEREFTGQPGILQQILHVQPHLKRVTFVGSKQRPGTKASLRIKTFSEEIATGPRPAGVLLDEIHLLGKDPKAENIVGQLRGGMSSNLEAFLLMLTTQSYEPPAGFFLSELTNARMVRSGERKGGTLLPIMYEFPDDIMTSEGWRDPANWPMVNPNLGLSVHLHLLKDDWASAQQKGEAAMRRWASQHVNIQVGVALNSSNWKGAKFWEKNADLTLAADHAQLKKQNADKSAKKAARLAELAELLSVCEVVTVGADGGGIDDLYGLVILGREPGDDKLERRKWRFWAHAWCHDSALQERQDIAPRLLDFEADGDLTIVAEPGEDSAEIADIVMMVEDAGLLPEKRAIGVDQIGIGGSIEELGRRGIDTTNEALRVVGIPQGYMLNGAIKEVERRLKAGRVKHNGSAMMNWVLGNAKVEPKGNAISITKQVSGSAKIDPLMAGFNAAALMLKNPEPQTSVFDKMDDEETQSDADGEVSADEEARILRDPTHPRWQEMRERFEARLPADDEVFY